MSADGSITIAWADGEHRFRLALGQLRELQEKTGVGPAVLYRRNADGEWRVDDLRETIRLGLCGGGMAPLDALRMVERYVDPRPLLESVPVAGLILLAALVGPPDDPLGKRDPARDQSEAQSSASPSPASTAPEPSSASRLQ